MLQLIDIRKSYQTGDFTQTALDGINLNFRDNEFVAILGPSGSGKTTTLNIIGGLDHYDTGDLVIDGVSTKKYKDRDWDTYRNNRIGFVFQSYNLIPHQTVLANVEMALTLSGVSRSERRERALAALEQVGLKDHVNKKPSQMSGGQMQRVAIARALINNPEILLADEPTGALDSKTSVQIMDLLTEIAQDRLVVMVTHNPELAEQYANRIVTLADGHITGDTNPFNPEPEDFRQSTKKIRRASMNFLTALSLSFNNLMTKKGRTIMTAFAGSIGIIGIAAILSLANGVNSYIESIEEETLSEYPLQITSTGFDMTSMLADSSMMGSSSDTSEGGADSGEDHVGVFKMVTNMITSIQTNDLATLKTYLESGESDIKDHVKSIEYDYGVTPLIYNSDTSGKIHQANPNTTVSQIYGSTASSFISSSSSSSNMFAQLPTNESLYKDSYDIKAGRWPENKDELVLVLSQSGRISDFLAYVMDLRDPDELSNAVKQFMNTRSVDEIDSGDDYYSYEQLMDVTFKLVNRADVYQYDEEYDVWIDKSDDTDYMRDLIDEGTTLKIVGIVQPSEDATASMLTQGLYYTEEMATDLVNYAAQSDIVQQQLAHQDIDVFSGKTFAEEEESSNDFDMSSLFSIDQDALQNAFSMDTDSMSIDMSSLSLDTSSMDASALANSLSFDPSTLDMSGLDFSDMPAMDFSGMEEAMSGSIKMNPEVLQNLFVTVLQGYFDAYKTAVAAGETPPTVDEYMALPETQAAMAQAMAGAFDTSALSEAMQTVMADYMTNTFQPYLQQKIATMLESVMTSMSNQIQSAITDYMSSMAGSISDSMSSAMSGLSSSLTDAFSIDEDAFKDAFQVNMDETTLQELMASMMSTDSASYDSNLSELGYADFNDPSEIDIYPIDFDAKQKVTDILDTYNQEKTDAGLDDEVISYTDIVGTLMSSVTTIINAISAVLIAFVAISLVVSSIMIGIITYISVLERKKEIGILRALGASKANISQVFNAETIIVGLLAGVIGVGLTGLACIPVSIIVKGIFDVPNVMQLPLAAAIILVCISVFLTFVGGLIPARSASHKDPVEALRSE